MSLPEFDGRTGAMIVFIGWIIHLIGAGIISIRLQNHILYGYTLGSMVSALVVRYIITELVKYRLQVVTDKALVGTDTDEQE